MSKKLNDINDDEIRIISSQQSREPAKTPMSQKRGGTTFLKVLFPILFIGVITAIVYLFWDKGDADVEFSRPVETVTVEENVAAEPIELPIKKAYTLVNDTVANGINMIMLTPVNATPSLMIGSENLDDPDIILAVQAADVRGDNGQIAGTFVLDGELISKGEAKAGFCSIIDDVLTIGVADATPMLEHAITDGGFFFRQYPLVVGGQVVENKPKGKARRKALAEIGGKICVIMTKERITFQEFSKALVDVGVRNAIYLVGASSYGFYKTENGLRFNFTKDPETMAENVNFLVWKQAR